MASGAGVHTQVAAALAVAAPAPPRPCRPLDGNNPARVAVLVPSHGVTLDGRALLAAGAGRHPTLIMLDGLPGWDNVYDVDLAVRASGWNVPIFRYRGIWGPAAAFPCCIRSRIRKRPWPICAARRSPPNTAGHSMGGFCALAAGLVLINPWNVGGDAKLVAISKEHTEYYIIFDNFGHSAHGATAKASVTRHCVTPGTGTMSTGRPMWPAGTAVRR